jgi:hypothetical protein
MKRRLLIPIAPAVFALSAVAAVAQTPTWNSGYSGWWPGGFGYPPVTVQAHNYPCSVTAYGPTFNHNATGWNQNYGGGTGCAGGVGQKTLTIYDQVLGQDGHTWFTITGSTFTAGPINGNPLRMIRNRPAYLGHGYRSVVFAKLVVPNGHAGCSLTNTCSQTITITAISRPLAP